MVTFGKNGLNIEGRTWTICYWHSVSVTIWWQILKLLERRKGVE